LIINELRGAAGARPKIFFIFSLPTMLFHFPCFSSFFFLKGNITNGFSRI
jgi:hypothetical protein